MTMITDSKFNIWQWKEASLSEKVALVERWMDSMTPGQVEGLGYHILEFYPDSSFQDCY